MKKRKIRVFRLVVAGIAVFVATAYGTVALMGLLFDNTTVVADVAEGDGGESVATLDNTTVYSEPPESYEPDEPYEPDLPPVYIEYEPEPEPCLEGAATLVVDNSLLPWYLKLVNRYNFLTEGFSFTRVNIVDWHYFDYRAADALNAMFESARSEGLRPVLASAHRSISHQRTLFENQVNRRIADGLSPEEAFEAARRVVAYPGTSEHNLGLAVDIVSYAYRNLTAHFGQTPEGRWLAENAHNYGFILRYPYHKQHVTNIIYEPWHFRYVGIASATSMFERDLVLEEYVYLRMLDLPHN